MRVEGCGATGATLAFTLLELLLVLAVMGLLLGLMAPGWSKARQGARRVVCVGNLRQLAQASLIYAAEDAGGNLSGRTEALDQSVAYLETVVGERKAFLCPNTRNRISAEKRPNRFTGILETWGLQELAAGREATHGSSYMSHAFIGHLTPYSVEVRQGNAGVRLLPYLRKTLDNVITYRKHHDLFGLGGTQPGPSRFWLMVDNHWYGDTRAYPDAADNHGSQGINASYCDGHVEWVPRRDFLFQYERDSDEGRQGVALPY
jgi:prepilin-type processing-associated H-X9-DG protein